MRKTLNSDSVIEIYGTVSKQYSEYYNQIELEVKQFDFKFGAGYKPNSIKTGSVIDFRKVKLNDPWFVNNLEQIEYRYYYVEQIKVYFEHAKKAKT